MATVNQVVGGSFLGVANGYLILRLNKNTVVNSSTLVCSTEIKIPLDNTGNIPTSPVYSVWPNDVMTPTDAYYLAFCYTSGGQLVWGPNAVTVLSSPSPFNVVTWIPS